jgi:ubiquinone/menaquinone biosynthesis C-methylase UbiE
MSDAQAHITAFWSTIASGYEAHGGNVAPYGTASYRRWREALAAVLPAPPADVLDVATGTGYLALAAASLGHRVTAIDLSAPMLDELRGHATERTLVVDARLGDAVAPDFPPASFHAVTNRHLLWTLREPEKALANWLALLRPGGRLVAVDGFWFTGADEAPPLFGEHYTPATRAQLPLMHLDHPDPIVGMLTAVGFVEVTAESRPDLALDGGVPYFFIGQRP